MNEVHWMDLDCRSSRKSHIEVHVDLDLDRWSHTE